MAIGYTVTSARLHTGRVRTAARDATIRTMPRAGAYIRGIARRSILRRKTKRSAPGRPPFTRSGRLKNAIRYDVGPARESVAIGPARESAGHLWQTLEYGGPPAARQLSGASIHVGGWGPIRAAGAFSLEKGGSALRIKLTTAAQVARARRLHEAENARRRQRRRNIAARPFMRPALAAAAPRLPDLWKNSIRS